MSIKLGLCIVLLSLLLSCEGWYDNLDDSSSYCDSDGCVYCDYYNDYHDVRCSGSGAYSGVTVVEAERLIQSTSGIDVK
jgi:hypothetical protein